MVLLDMRLPDDNGMDLLNELIAKGVAVIVMTAYGEVSDAVGAMKQGATDYLKKPVDLEELLLVVKKVEATTKLKHQLNYSRQRDTRATEGTELLGDSPGHAECAYAGTAHCAIGGGGRCDATHCAYYGRNWHRQGCGGAFAAPILR